MKTLPLLTFSLLALSSCSSQILPITGPSSYGEALTRNVTTTQYAVTTWLIIDNQTTHCDRLTGGWVDSAGIRNNLEEENNPKKWAEKGKWIQDTVGMGMFWNRSFLFLLVCQKGNQVERIATDFMNLDQAKITSLKQNLVLRGETRDGKLALAMNYPVTPRVLKAP